MTFDETWSGDPPARHVVSWSWKAPGTFDLDLTIRGERLRVYVPEQDRETLAEALYRLAAAVRPPRRAA